MQMESVERCLLSIVVKNNWYIEQLDINNAILHGDLNEQWFEKLTTFLLQLGLKQSYVDTSLFTITYNGTITSLLVYVDDILLISKDNNFIKEIKTKLHDKFSIKDIGPLHYYLGIEFIRNLTGLAMTQRKYALELPEYVEVLDIKPITTPMDTIIKLNDSDGYLLPGPSTYRTLVGKLLCLTITRPDLSFAAQILSQYSHSPRSSHYEALIKVLRYIKLCPGQGLFFPQQNINHLTTYCDSDWASCATTRLSVTGAIADNTCEISWLKCLLLDLGITTPTQSLVMCDNASTIALANNPIHHARTKRIEIDCHFVKDKIKQGQISLCFVPSRLQIIDILTKEYCIMGHHTMTNAATGKHMNQYKVGYIKVTERCLIIFMIGKYKDEIVSDIADINAYHPLLVMPWAYDANATKKEKKILISLMVSRWFLVPLSVRYNTHVSSLAKCLAKGLGSVEDKMKKK
ncbi:uncharacterized mitochondrial protein-like protein [Tanacetum coccineum]